WGRYLGDKDDVSIGLDNEEVEFLHEKDVKILVIYNHVENATGYEHGGSEAEEAISYAEDLNIPEDVAIFGDIEPNYPVDSAFLDGWYETLADSKYKAGIYGVFDDDSKLLEAYHATSQKKKDNADMAGPDQPDEISATANAAGQEAVGKLMTSTHAGHKAERADNSAIITEI